MSHYLNFSIPLGVLVGSLLGRLLLSKNDWMEITRVKSSSCSKNLHREKSLISFNVELVLLICSLKSKPFNFTTVLYSSSPLYESLSRTKQFTYILHLIRCRKCLQSISESKYATWYDNGWCHSGNVPWSGCHKFTFRLKSIRSKRKKKNKQ